MYQPALYAESRVEELHRLIREHPFGMLVANTPSGLEANHIPFVLEAERGEQGVLLAHVARANPIWREMADAPQVLVVFRGVHGYISPNWYESKAQTHRHVPTWNYEIVHAHGTIHVRDDEKFVRGVVARLTRRHEADQPQPWKMSDAPADYLAEQLSHIVGIEIRLMRLEGKRKLNQHHQTPDREGAIRGLESAGNTGLAQVIRDTAMPAT